MTEASHNVFIDRRTEVEVGAGLATQILFWYDKDKKNRTRTNGIAITIDGEVIIARSTCSKKDQFERATGRMKVANRIFGRAQKHCWIVPTFLMTSPDDAPTRSADAYTSLFSDDMGVKRAYNAGNVYRKYMAEIQRRIAGEVDA